MFPHLVEIRLGLNLARSLIPLEVLGQIIRDRVLWAPAEQPLRLSEGEATIR